MIVDDVTDPLPPKLVERTDLRNRTRVFDGRSEGGAALAEMLDEYRGTDALVLAIPAGGVPVGAAVAERLGLPLDVAVVSKITPAWNTEVGYGAVAFDGSAVMNDDLVRAFGLSDEELRAGRQRTEEKVRRRVEALRGGRPVPDLTGRTAIVTDDGLASGFTMRCALEAVARLGAAERIVAVPTAHEESVGQLAERADTVYCPNVRAGPRFAVAEAYRHWYDVTEREVAEILSKFKPGDACGR